MEAFKEIDWSLTADSHINRSMIKCIVKDFGLFEENENGNGAFNKGRMVKQLGGEEVRARVEKCIDGNSIGEPTVDESVQKVMMCLQDDKLDLYKE